MPTNIAQTFDTPIDWILYLLITIYHNHLGIFLVPFIFTFLFFFHKIHLKTKNSKNNNISHKKKIVVLFLVILGGFFLRLYNVGQSDFFKDEFQVISTAKNYQEKQEFYLWDWIGKKSGKTENCLDKEKFCHYNRAFPHTFLIAQVFKILDVSEFSGRIISVLFGTLLIWVGYFLTYFFTKEKNVALLVALLFAIHPEYIVLSRYARMYILWMPLFGLTTYFLYRGITEPNKFTLKSKKLQNIFNSLLNFNFPALIIGILFLFFTYLIHLNTLILLPVFSLFIFYLGLNTRKLKYLTATIFIFSGILLFLFLLQHTNNLNSIKEFISIFEQRNTFYLKHLFSFPFFKELNIIFFSGFVLSIWHAKSHTLKHKLVFLNILVIFSIIFFIYIANRYIKFVYVSAITPFVIIGISYVFYKIVNAFNSQIFKGLLWLLLFYFIGHQFYLDAPRIYTSKCHKHYDCANFSTATRTVLNNFNSKKDLLLSTYKKNYYLKSLPKNTHYASYGNKEIPYTYENFKKDTKDNDSIWIIWQSVKARDFDPKFIKFICQNAKHFHGNACGENLDDTNVEVFHFTKKEKHTPK